MKSYQTTPYALINLVESNEPITDLITKFGDQPTWLNKPM